MYFKQICHSKYYMYIWNIKVVIKSFLRRAVVEIDFLQIHILHVGTLSKSLELQLVQLKCIQILKDR